jgi:hypothetical protein
MWFRQNTRIPLLALIAVLCAGLSLSAQDSAHRGRKYKAPPPTSRIEVTILRDGSGKPIENAAVIFQLVHGEQGNMELKTNEDGKTTIDVLPTGSTVRLQVIAKGFQTYGEDFKIDKPEMAVEVKLKRPGEQYSIYKKHDQASDSEKSADQNKSADAGKDAAPKDAAKDKQDESAKESDNKPSSSQPQPQ